MDSKSIFHLESSPDGLMDSGVRSFFWKQYACTRDVEGQNFSNGVQRWRWQGASNEWWLPSQSYLRYRIKITSTGGAEPEVKDNIAPAMNTCSQLYQSCTMKMGGQTVSRINDYLPIYDTLKKRMNLSKSLLDSTCDTKGNFEADFKCRQSKLAKDAIRFDKVQSVYPAAIIAVAVNGADTLAYDIINGVPTITLATMAGTDFTTLLNVGDIVQFESLPGVGTIPESGKYVQGRLVTVGATVLTLDRPIAGDAAAAADVGNRIAVIYQNAENPDNVARGKNEIELLWKPPLSLFDYEGALPMCAKYELELVPQVRDSLKKRAVQSVYGDKVPCVDFDVEISQVYLYLAEVSGPAIEDATFYLDMKEMNIQADKIDNFSLGQKNFDVANSTHALTVLYQDERANNDTRVSDSIFKSFNTDLSNVEARDVSSEQKLTRFYLQYAGCKYPQIDWDPSFTDRKDNFTQLWLETACATGGKYDTGGHETIDDWLNRGLYLHFKTPKAPTDRSTRVSVHQAFGGATQDDITNMRVMLVDHHSAVWQVELKDGRVKSVKQFQI